MFDPIVGVISNSDSIALCINDHGAYTWIRRGEPDAPTRKIQGSLHELFVGVAINHEEI